ncbi:MAG: DUF4199 family protein [Alphaproteobacteria bacterium]|nr:DUF4199 family protein [Alphaproteobacteria bacterium]
MLRTVFIYGALAGLIVGVPLSIFVIAAGGHDTQYGMLIGYLTMLVGLSAVFVAIKRRRDRELGGVIKFWPAFGMGLAISAVAGVIYVISWETATAVAHLDFASAYAKAMIAQQEAKGVGGEALEKFTAQMDEFKKNYANPLYRWPMTFAEIFPVGVLVSLISAGLLRNPRFMPAQRG